MLSAMKIQNPLFYSVTEITSQIKQVLRQQFSSIGVEGEISNFRPSSAGHWYFTLKDGEASLSCVMFRYQSFRVPFKPADGMRIRVIGGISVYEKRGTYQIICEAMEQVGSGELLQQLEERKQRLHREGLFDEERKRPLPRLPKTVGLITSPTGAALRDILNVLNRRNSGIHIIIYPSAVQGDEAAVSLRQQLQTAQRRREVDVLIIGRGGGSIEDLLPFSDEQLVREVAASTIPVISAVGHDIDWALTDYAADLRAPTPSAAAELVSSPREEVYEFIRSVREQALQTVRNRMEHARLVLRPFRPEELQRQFNQLVQPYRLAADDLAEACTQEITRTCERTRHTLDALHREIEARSPRAVMKRGFSVVTHGDHHGVITDASQAPGDTRVHITFYEGERDAVIEHKEQM